MALCPGKVILCWHIRRKRRSRSGSGLQYAGREHFDQGVQLAFRQIKVNDLVALAAVKMLMGVGVPVKAFGTADHANATDHIVISQGVQVAVHRAQADMRAALTA